MGRPAGSRNKTTLSGRALAIRHAQAAMTKLAKIAIEGESEAAQVAACKEILDRAYGKAPQALTGEDGSGPIKHVLEVVWGASNARAS